MALGRSAPRHSASAALRGGGGPGWAAGEQAGWVWRKVAQGRAVRVETREGCGPLCRLPGQHWGAGVPLCPPRPVHLSGAIILPLVPAAPGPWGRHLLTVASRHQATPRLTILRGALPPSPPVCPAPLVLPTPGPFSGTVSRRAPSPANIRRSYLPLPSLIPKGVALTSRGPCRSPGPP